MISTIWVHEILTRVTVEPRYKPRGGAIGVGGGGAGSRRVVVVMTNVLRCLTRMPGGQMLSPIV